jgi:plastocyanin
MRGEDPADIDKAVDEDGDILRRGRSHRGKRDYAEQPGCAQAHKAHATRMRASQPLFAQALGAIAPKLIGRIGQTVVFLFLVFVVSFAGAVAVHRIVQKGRAFAVGDISIARGDTVLFTNEDEFLHQIYVDSKNMSFDSAEQPPGQTIEINFPRSGTFPVRCHIHPKMLLTVRVE